MKDAEFDRVVSSRKDRLFGYAFYFLGKREEAEDVVQDAFVRLWQNRKTLDRRRVDGWLISVTRNLCRDCLRRRKVRSAIALDLEAIENATEAGLPPDEWASEKVFADLVRRSLVGLPEPQKSIVILREIEGMSYNEIGRALGLSLNSVKVYLHRGRRALRKQLARVVDRETA